MAQPESQDDDLTDLGAIPVEQDDDLSDLGAVESAPQDDDLSDLGGIPLESVSKSVETSFPTTTGIVKEGAKRIFSVAKDIAENPNMQSLDPASKAGLTFVNAAQGVFDESGEKVAEKLAYHGMNPYAAALGGSVIQYIPDILLSAEGLSALKAAGNAKAESAILEGIVKKAKPLALEYKAPIETPTTILEGGEAAIPLEAKSTGLLKPPSSKMLEAPKTIEGPGFISRESPDLAKIQEADLMSGQPKRPEDIGNLSMRGYASKRKLSADVPEFPKLETSVAPADMMNPVVSDLVDESRKQYIGIDPRLSVTKDMKTGRTTFRLKQDPTPELRTATEPEVTSNNFTKTSPAVEELGIDPRIVDASPVLPNSQTLPVMKDNILANSPSWIQSAWNRLGAAAEDVIAKMGQGGTQLANGVRIVRDVPQVRYGDFAAGFDDLLRGLSKQQAKKVSVALSEALEGKTPSTELPKGLLEYVKSKLNVIADEAETVGLSIRNQAGEVVPFAPRENYFPRMLRQEIFDGLLAGDNKVMRQIAEKMVANRQETSVPVAFERVKYLRTKMGTMKYGHLERAREFDLPPEFYDRNALRVIPEYMNSALHRIEEARQFGVQGERALEMLSTIKDEGFDHELARKIFERFTRIEPRDKIYLQGAQGLRNLAAGMLIQAQSTILQLGQAMTPAYEAGFTNAVKGFAKSFTSLGENQAKRAGQVFTTAAQDYLKEAYGGAYGFAGKFADSVLNITGFARMDHFLRKYSSLVGREYIEKDLVPMLIKNPSSKKAVVELQNLGYDTAKILRNKGISAEELNVGAKRFADQTQGAPDVTRLPEFWTTWQGKLLGQFKNFSYVIGKQNVSMIKRAIETGNVTRLGEMAVGMPVTGYILKTLRDAMAGENNVEITGQEDVDAAIQVMANATAFGPGIDLFLLAMQGPDKLESFFLPVSVKNVTAIGGAAGTALKQGELEPLLKTLTKKTPVVGRMLYNKIYGE